jgi:hypothetical protein
VLAAGAGALMLALRNAAFREQFDAGWLRMPLIGRLARGYNATRFSGTLAMLAGAGVPILKALQAAAETLSNSAMRADALEALVQVREGAPLASALARPLARNARTCGATDRRRSAAPRDGFGDDPRAVAHRRNGRGRDADRARRAAADHPAQYLGAVIGYALPRVPRVTMPFLVKFSG